MASFGIAAPELGSTRRLAGLAWILPAAAALSLLGAAAVFEPTTVLLAAVALAVVVVCALRVDLALLLLVAAAPIEGAFASASSFFLTPAKIAGALAFGSFVLHAATTRRKLVFDRTHVIVGLLLATALVSTLQARELAPALSTTIRYASFVALYVLVSQFVGAHALQRRLAWVLSISSAIAGVLAIRNFLADYTYQATLTYGDPNDLAFMLAATLPLTFWLLRERWLLRPLVVALIAVISLAIVLTYSRGALVGIGAGILWLAMTERRRIPLLVAGGLLTLVVSFVFVQATPETTFQFDEGLQAKTKVSDYNVETRLDAWNAAARLTADHPFLGVGPGNFQSHYPETSGIPPGVETIAVVHNAYLDVAAELGVVALLLFLAYLAEVFARLTVSRRRGYGLPGYASAVRTAFVISMVAAITLSEQYFAPFWLLGALGTALWTEGRRSQEGAAEPQAVSEPAEPDRDGNYYRRVRERVLKERERQLAVRIEAALEEEARLENRTQDLAQRATYLDRREQELARRSRELAAREQRLARRAQRTRRKDSDSG